MGVAWRFQGAVLVVTEGPLCSSDEIERVILRGALSDPRCEEGVRVLWDARQSEWPLSSEDVAWRTNVMAMLADYGVASRFAYVVRSEQRVTIELGRSEIAKAVVPLVFQVFTSESEALGWLETQPGAFGDTRGRPTRG